MNARGLWCCQCWHQKLKFFCSSIPWCLLLLACNSPVFFLHLFVSSPPPLPPLFPGALSDATEASSLAPTNAKFISRQLTALASLGFVNAANERLQRAGALASEVTAASTADERLSRLASYCTSAAHAAEGTFGSGSLVCDSSSGRLLTGG